MRRRKTIAVTYVEDGPIEDQLPELKEIALRRDQAALDTWHEDHQMVQLRRGEALPNWWAQYFDVSDYAPVGGSPMTG